MSKIKIVNILILLVLLISFNLETVNVFAGPNDIIITKVVQKRRMFQPVKVLNSRFTIKMCWVYL